jgi:hypothetical protein
MKANSAISQTLQPRSNVTFESAWQRLKQHLEIPSSDEGTQTDRSEEHSANADSPRIEISLPHSNAKYEVLENRMKGALEIVVTDEGIQMK